MSNEDIQAQPNDDDSAWGSAWCYSRRGYAVAQSFRQLKRYRLANSITLLVLGITLALPTLLFFVSSALLDLGARSIERESLTAYFYTDISDLDGSVLAQEWQSLPDIEQTQFVSKSAALELMSASTDIGSLVNNLGDNPLPGAVIIYPHTSISTNTESMEALALTFQNMSSVERVQVDLHWVKRLQAVVALVQLIGFVLAGFLTLTALLVIANTIRLELIRRRREIEVANLLGANRRFMRRSILYTGGLYGLIGGFFACAIALLALNAIRLPADDLSSLYNSTFRLTLPDASQVFFVLGSSMLLGIVGAASSLYGSSQQVTQGRTMGH